MSQRLHGDYPWPVWAVGWLAVLKAFVWLGAEPASLPDRQLMLMGYKYVIFMLPLLVCGIGAWRMKKWAAWGLIMLAVADLLFFLLSPAARASLALNSTSPVAHVFSMTVYIINGPPGAVMILLLSPALIRRLEASS
jgi:hypothetical protein